MPVRCGTQAGQGDPAPAHDAGHPTDACGPFHGRRRVQAQQHPATEVQRHHGRAGSRLRTLPRPAARPQLAVEDQAQWSEITRPCPGDGDRQQAQEQARGHGAPPPRHCKFAQGRRPDTKHGGGRAKHQALNDQPDRFRADVDPDGRRRALHGVCLRLIRSPRKQATGGIAAAPRAQARRKTSVPFVPPKPKLFLTATSIFISRAVLAQ